MHLKSNRLPFAALGATAALTGFATGAAAVEACYADWGAASQIIRQFKLMTVDQLTKEAAGQLGGQIVKTTLCKDGDDYIYKVVVRDSKGALKTVVMGADSASLAATKR
jgi:hypothetical protein